MWQCCLSGRALRMSEGNKIIVEKVGGRIRSQHAASWAEIHRPSIHNRNPSSFSSPHPPHCPLSPPGCPAKKGDLMLFIALQEGDFT